MPKQDLSALPRHIIKLSKKWYRNTKTGSWIPAAGIAKYLPKPPVDHERVLAARHEVKVTIHEQLQDEQLYMRTIEQFSVP